MTHSDRNPICSRGTQPDTAVEELRLIGGDSTVEGRRLTAAAAAAGVSVRWLDFASAEAQAAIAAQGPGAIRLPLVIVGGTHTLQRPPFAAVSACAAALRSGRSPLPAGAIALTARRPGALLSAPFANWISEPADARHEPQRGDSSNELCPQLDAPI
jgi:hypothetical protein